MSKNVGIQVRHSRECPAAENREAVCRCRPSYRAEVWDRKRGTKLRKTFPTISAAKAWRHDASTSVRRGTMRASSPTTLREAMEAWVAGARDGSIFTPAGSPYRPSVIRSYEQAFRLYLLDDLGAAKLTDVDRHDVQDVADRLLARGLDPSTVRNALMPLRPVFRRAVARGEVAVNPTSGVELPAVRGRRDRIASPTEAAELLAALPERDRALWATALFAGLRRGELMGLRWEEVDLAANIIHVERSYDPRAGVFIEPKSRAGTRRVPIASALRGHQLEHRSAPAAQKASSSAGPPRRPSTTTVSATGPLACG
jgi:integrase